ncbi:MAG TPA: YIP1 family protein [Rubrobacteraceae bacterium]|nr:YIP1 family protein [Rubrobacteraceae bacterium]
MQTEQQSYGEAGGTSGEAQPGAFISSATEEFTYADPLPSFVGTVRDLVTRPVGFFRGIARRGDYANPLVFALVCAVISAVIGGFLGVLYATVGIGDTTVGEAVGAFVASMFFTPIIFAIALFVGAGVLHLLVALIIKPADTGFEATFRVVSYANVTELVTWVPILGPLVAAVASIALAIVGVREVHETTTGKAALVVLIPAAVGLLIVSFLIALVGAALFFAAQ